MSATAEELDVLKRVYTFGETLRLLLEANEDDDDLRVVAAARAALKLCPTLEEWLRFAEGGPVKPAATAAEYRHLVTKLEAIATCSPRPEYLN